MEPAIFKKGHGNREVHFSVPKNGKEFIRWFLNICELLNTQQNIREGFICNLILHINPDEIENWNNTDGPRKLTLCLFLFIFTKICRVDWIKTIYGKPLVMDYENAGQIKIDRMIFAVIAAVLTRGDTYAAGQVSKMFKSLLGEPIHESETEITYRDVLGIVSGERSLCKVMLAASAKIPHFNEKLEFVDRKILFVCGRTHQLARGEKLRVSLTPEEIKTLSNKRKSDDQPEDKSDKKSQRVNN